MSSNSSSCTIPTTKEVAIQPPSDGAEERAIVWPGPCSLLSIDWKGENSGYWFPHWWSLLGRTSGSVREAATLRCPAAVSVWPLVLSPVLKCQRCPPAFLSLSCYFSMPIFISACEMYSSRQLGTEAPAFHEVPERRCGPHLSPSPSLSSLK